MGGLGFPFLPTAQAPNVPDIAPATPKAEIDRPFGFNNYSGAGSSGYLFGFDKAPPPSIPIYWQMRRYSTIVLAFAITTAPVLASPRTIEIVGDPKNAGLAKELKEKAMLDCLPAINEAFGPALECVHFGNWLQETIWDRSDGRTVPREFRSILPGEAVIFRDQYKEFSGYQIGSEFRDARYALHVIHNKHINSIWGESRLDWCREEWWRVLRSKDNADATERKASMRQLKLGIPQGTSFIDNDGKQVFPEAFGQKIQNAAVEGRCIVYPITPFTQADIKSKPELWDIPAVKIELIDWGDIGPSLMAHLKRCDFEDIRIMRAMRRPEREAMEGSHGTKAEAGTHGQIGVTDSELLADMVLKQFDQQVLDRWAVTNFPDATPGMIRVKQAPLSDPQQVFLQDAAKLLMSGAAPDEEFEAQIDRRKLGERVEIPMLSEEEAATNLAVIQKEKADAAQQQSDALKAKSGMNGNGAVQVKNGTPKTNGNGRMALDGDHGGLAARLRGYLELGEENHE